MAIDLFEELDPEPRLLMGPGPVDIYPRVLRAMSSPIVGQFDPGFTEHMNQVMTLYRHVFRTGNHWTMLVDGSARAGIECCMTSILARGDKVVVPVFGRFGQLLVEICGRLGANVITLETAWGTVFDPGQIIEAVRRHRPKLVAVVHGDTSTTLAQPLDSIGPACRELGTLLYTDATATLGGNPVETDAWQVDAISAGLQKCLSGPPGVAPISINERVVKVVQPRHHIEVGIRPADYATPTGPMISSNYFDLPMLMDYWGPARLNHHTQASSMLYAARECARIVLQEGLDRGIARHRLSSAALRAGLTALDLDLFGDAAHRMTNVTGIFIPKAIRDGEKVRAELLTDFGLEIGTSFGPLRGRVWRIGTMGHVCRKQNILRCLTALEAVLRRHGHAAPAGAAIDAALGVYDRAAREADPTPSATVEGD